MTDKEFRRLSRGKLIELILAQGREIRRLEEELEETEAQLRNRAVSLPETGSLVETGEHALARLRETQEKADRCMAELRRILSERKE